MIKRRFRNIIKVIFTVIVIGTLAIILYARTLHLDPPDVSDEELVSTEVRISADGERSLGDNWLRPRTENLYEMYIEGRPFERGQVYGMLAEDLVVRQEDHFVAQIRELVPSRRMLFFLKYFIGFFNRKIDKHIPQEYLEEIYGVSLSASEDYQFIGSNYERLLNYHAAHDIGHALSSYMLVGCSSFAVWGESSQDGKLLIGRNFDFYVGDDFAREKIVCFVNPAEGIPYATISWGGMMGVVSGMNHAGLTVTINAAKSDIPRKAATPISILAREILQYATNIEEAYAIAERRQTFVSESILIGSASDGRSAIIEKSPKKISIYKEDDSDIICTNHYQSDLFGSDENNKKYKEGSASLPRYQRLEQLLSSEYPLTYQDAAAILRDRKGLNDKDVGMGNEHALNQLIAHHSIIFQPGERRFWVSDYPYQLGAYIAYDLDHIFGDGIDTITANDTLANIDEDPFYNSEDFGDYLKYREYLDALDDIRRSERDEYAMFADSVVDSNPENFYSYVAAGEYHMKARHWDQAVELFESALSKNGISVAEREHINGLIEKSRKHLN